MIIQKSLHENEGFFCLNLYTLKINMSIRNVARLEK